MTLATGQRALMASRVGKMRLGAVRLSFYQPWIKVLINGVDRSSLVRVSECTITDELNNEPNIATVRVSGFTPVKGQEIKVYMGDTDVTHQLFGGRILSVDSTYEAEKPANAIWVCQCIDYTWLLNRRKVIKKYTSQSATAIVLDLISTFTSGFTTVNVVTGLATIDEITFTNDDVTDCLTRIAERIGGYWYVDYASDLHFFLTETIAATSITTALPRGMFGIVQGTDLSQIATRVTCRGGGANALSDVLAANTTLPIEDSSWYGASGTVEVGQNRVTYSGVSAVETGSTTGFVNPPPQQSSLAGASGGSLTASSTYLVAMSYVTAEGETTISPTKSVTLTGGQNEITGSITVPTDPKVTSKNVFVSSAGGDSTTLRRFGNFAASVTTVTITSYTLGNPQQSATNTAGFGSESAPAGSTTLQVEDLSLFPSSGWAEAPGGQVFSYTGRSSTSGGGTLTGIPASGPGSLTAAVRAGTVKAVPYLSGCSGITYAINKGDPVNVIVTVNDATAQTALAGFVGGDGIHEMFISDGRWGITEATARANAELTLRKDPLVSIKFSSRDQSLQSGRDITLTLSSPSISGTFKIQRVTLSELGLQGPRGWVFPLRQVEASSRRYSFEDVLRRLKERAT